jgi:predicted transcriptional regulator
METTLLVKEVMTPKAEWVDPKTTLLEAAKRMRDKDIGSLLVGEHDKIIGMVTDPEAARSSFIVFPKADTRNSLLLRLFQQTQPIADQELVRQLGASRFFSKCQLMHIKDARSRTVLAP